MEEYGVIMYDISEDKKNVYHAIRRQVTKFAVPLNLSVYLTSWGLKSQVDKLIQKYGQPGVDIKFVKFDSSSNEELKQMAHKSLEALLTQIQKSIRGRVNQLKERDDYFFTLTTKNKIKHVYNLITMFGFTQELTLLFEATKKLFQEELLTN